MAMARTGILVLVITAGTGNGACNYMFQVRTGRLPDRFLRWPDHPGNNGTDGFIDFGLYQKDGAGWDRYRVDAGGGDYHIGETDTFSTVNHLCIDPCGLLLEFRMRILGRRPQWYCEWVNVTVFGDGDASSHHHMFTVDRFFNLVFPRANINNCG